MTAAVEETGLGQAASKATAMVRDSVKTVIAASMVGTAIEFYDFYAYGTAAANYFPHIFFSDKANPTVALLMSLLTFAIAFIARPLGSLVFGHFGDRMGRKTTLVVSLMTMGVGTFLIGCLPTYDQVGVAAVAILCLLRFIQGIGLGGLVVRVHMEETPIFRMAQEQKKVVKSPLAEVFRKSWRQVLQATFLVAVTYTLFYTLATWSLAWGTKDTANGGGNLGFTNQEYLLMLMISICVFALFIVLSCLYADKLGRRRVLTFSSCALVVFAVLFPFLLDGQVVGQHNFFANMVFLCVGFALMGIAFGPIGAFLPELFDANVRYSGSGIGYNLAAIVGAAFVPTIATWLAHNWGVHSVGLYLAVMAVCCLVSVLTCKETKDVDFTK